MVNVKSEHDWRGVPLRSSTPFRQLPKQFPQIKNSLINKAKRSMKAHLSDSSDQVGLHQKLRLLFSVRKGQEPPPGSLVVFDLWPPSGKLHSHNHDRRNQMTRKKKGVTR